MSRFPFILLFSLLGIMVLNAQTPLERMNSIKMSNEYVWDEYTHASADTAAAGAIQRLLLYIDVPDGRTLTTDDIQPSVKLIKMKRSNLTRVFAYLKKEEAQTIARFGRVEANDTTSQADLRVEYPHLQTGENPSPDTLHDATLSEKEHPSPFTPVLRSTSVVQWGTWHWHWKRK